MKIFFQTIINFVAFERLLTPLVQMFIPINALGGLLSLVYWIFVLVLSYTCAVYFFKDK